METINTETEELEILIQSETTTRNNLFNAPSLTHLFIYMAGVLIILGMIALLFQSITSPVESNEAWIKTIKFNHQNDQYFRHPKY